MTDNSLVIFERGHNIVENRRGETHSRKAIRPNQKAYQDNNCDQNIQGRLPGEKQFADQLRIVLAEPVDKNDPKSVRKLRRIAEKLVECAMKGEGWAISQVADRIDGKATAEIQTEQRHRYVIEAPAQLTREQWIQKYSPPPPIGTSTPSDESLVLSNECSIPDGFVTHLRKALSTAD
jgi:hypothetical protein